MKNIQQWLTGSLLGLMCSMSYAQDETFAMLLEGVEDGCPAIWHDLTVTIDPSADPATLFGPSPDQIDFETTYQAVYGQPDDQITPAEMAAVIASTDAIALACNAHRKVLFEAMLATNTADSDAALEAALGVANAVDFASRQWSVGDLRTTSRATAEEGWIFPVGQTVGPEGSGADLSGDDYRELFEVVKMMEGNNSGATWSGGAGSVIMTVTLPDLRGRAVYAANNMGGSVPPVPPATANTDVVRQAKAGTIGGLFGKEDYKMTTAQMPNHNHAMEWVGNHNHDSSAMGNHVHGMQNSPSHGHTMGNAGAHNHHLRTSAYEGSGAPGTSTYMTGKKRTNYQNTITHSVNGAPSHKHTLSSSGVHKHTITGGGGHDHSISNSGSHKHSNVAAGGSAAFKTTSPGITMNIEMKY